MAAPTKKLYSTFQDFERDLLRPEMRIGWSTDEIESSGAQELDFDLDPFEASLWKGESEGRGR